MPPNCVCMHKYMFTRRTAWEQTPYNYNYKQHWRLVNVGQLPAFLMRNLSSLHLECFYEFSYHDGFNFPSSISKPIMPTPSFFTYLYSDVTKTPVPIFPIDNYWRKIATGLRCFVYRTVTDVSVLSFFKKLTVFVIYWLDVFSSTLVFLIRSSDTH